MKHILTARQFDPAQMRDICLRTDFMREETLADASRRRELLKRHVGKIMASVFYEPSTRTRMSFASAAHRLGMDVIETENAAEFSSAAKGETIEDTARVMGGYGDIVVMRHKENGAAERAAKVSPVPIINAGDGTGEHPTQALLDMYTIQDKKGRLDNLNVVIGGDLRHGRTARSLAQTLAQYPGNTISFVSTAGLQMENDVLAYLDENNTPHSRTDDMHQVLPTADVVYWTRLQKERLRDPSMEHAFIFGRTALAALNEDAIIMHPLPRVNEIEPEVDDDPRAVYMEQATNGLYVRMALLDMIGDQLA